MKLKFKEHWPLYTILLGITLVVLNDVVKRSRSLPNQQHHTKADSLWLAPSLFLDNQLEGVAREQVIYGQELILNTAAYFGPYGKVAATTNGMEHTLHSVMREYLKEKSPVTPTPPRSAMVLDAPQTLLTQVTGVAYTFR